jgi:hypothetical protein
MNLEYEHQHATDFALDLVSRGHEPIHYVSRETLYEGPAAIVSTQTASELADELGDNVTTERFGHGQAIIRHKQSSKLANAKDK